MNSEKIPSEIPSRAEQLRILREEAEKLEVELSRFNLPKNLPDDDNFLPASLDEDEKAKIIIIREQLRSLKNRQKFLEDSNEIKQQ